MTAVFQNSKDLLVNRSFRALFFSLLPFLILAAPLRAAAVALIEPDSLLQLTEYDRNYLLFGAPNYKIQMSVMAAPIRNFPLYGTYTQVMFWQSIKDAGPFKEVNFDSSLFYRWTTEKVPGFTAFDFGFFDHKSNGQGGAPRRSYNDSFVDLHSDHIFGNQSFLSTTRLFVLYGLDEENQDMNDFMGWWQTSLSYIIRDTAYFKLLEVYATVHPGGRWGTNFDRGNQELGLRLKINPSSNFPYLYIQYFRGYGEGLATYNENVSSLRIGFQL